MTKTKTIKLTEEEKNFILDLGEITELNKWTILKTSKNGSLYFYDNCYHKKMSLLDGLKDYGNNIFPCTLLKYKNGIEKWNALFKSKGLDEYLYSDDEVKIWIKNHKKWIKEFEYLLDHSIKSKYLKNKKGK